MIASKETNVNKINKKKKINTINPKKNHKTIRSEQHRQKVGIGGRVPVVQHIDRNCFVSSKNIEFNNIHIKSYKKQQTQINQGRFNFLSLPYC